MTWALVAQEATARSDQAAEAEEEGSRAEQVATAVQEWF